MNTKPPLGITPRWFLDEEREAEIWRAITRYAEAGYPIPMEWYQELDEIIERLSPISLYMKENDY